MRVVLIFRVSAQRLVLVVGIWFLQACEIAVPVAVAVCHVAEEVLAQIAEIVCCAVALAVAVVELVAHLQERSLPQRLAVCCLHRVAPRLCGCHVVAVCLVCGVGFGIKLALYLVEVHVVCRQALAVALVVRALQTQRHVTSHAVELAVQLQRASHLLAVAVRQRVVAVAVHHQPLCRHLLYGLFCQRVADVQVRVIVI